jgi:hypothetical protein
MGICKGQQATKDRRLGVVTEATHRVLRLTMAGRKMVDAVSIAAQRRPLVITIVANALNSPPRLTRSIHRLIV